MATFQIEGQYYPIVYVRGYAMTADEREDVFHDAYYGFGVTSVEKRNAPPPKQFEADLFEGLLIRLIKDHDYIDSTNKWLNPQDARTIKDREDQKLVNPSRSIWVSRFYDADYFTEKVRAIEDHATEVCELIANIRIRMEELDVDTSNFKVILLAHSMGGLVCRALIQKWWREYALAKNKGENAKIDPDPKNIIHRFVTMGTPHRGIDLGAVPDFVENTIVTKFNPGGSSIFKDERMREYLDLGELKNPPKKGKPKTTPNPEDYLYDVHSLGARDRFPIKRCLCLIGSDWNSYGAVRKLTGGVSDGLVKQSRAYLVTGPRPDQKLDPGDTTPNYALEDSAFWANVHRAHSGYRGIVNSYESYENIQRFLFGTNIFHIGLERIALHTNRDPEDTYVYDFEFMLSIRGTATYLHRRQQDPCENAFRIKIDKDNPSAPTELFLHTGFLNSKLRLEKDPHSYFRLSFQIVERHVKKGFLWDHDYPANVIYNEMMDARVNDAGVEYRWLSDMAAKSGDGWQKADSDGSAFRAPMRHANSFDAELVVRAGRWPDQAMTLD